MIKMVKAKATVSGVEWDLRKEFYEKYMEDFQIIKEYEIMDAAELEADAEVKEVPVVEKKVSNKKKGK